MSILSIMLMLGIVILLVLPMWSIVACDFWRSIVFKEGVKLPYPWFMTLLGPTIMSAICVGVACLVHFDVWMATGLCLFCVVNGMMSGLVEAAKKDQSCELKVFVVYFAVIVVFLFATMRALSLASW